MIAALLACACLALVACGTAVPDVKGMTIVQARQVVAAAGFKVGGVTYDEKATGAAGAVSSQAPEAGTAVKAGTAIALMVVGPPPVAVPALSGLAKAAAEAALSNAGLTLGVVGESYDATIAVGMVTTQTPAPGLEAAKGSAVAIVLSRGPEPVAVPRVVGKTKAAATAALQSAGFKVRVVNKADTAKSGTVIAQKPAGGKTKPGSTVTITVSTGVVMVRVPDVVGAWWKSTPGTIQQSKAFAVRLLSAVGLRANVVFNQAVTPSQKPKAGALVPRGTVVTVILLYGE